MANIPPGVVTTIGDISRPAVREVGVQRVQDVVKKQLRDLLKGIISSNVDATSINAAIQNRLGQLVNQDVISNFVLDSVEVGPHKPFREVDCLPVTALPGDPLTVNVVQPDGSVKEEYRGIIISADGQGNGIIFSKPGESGEEGQVRVSCKVKPKFPLEYITIKLQQDF
jgi:hypothetical protein